MAHASPHCTVQLPQRLIGIGETDNDSYILPEWLPQRDADALLHAIESDMAAGVFVPSTHLPRRFASHHRAVYASVDHDTMNHVVREPSPFPRQRLPHAVDWRENVANTESAAKLLYAVAQRIDAQVVCIATQLGLGEAIELDEDSLAIDDAVENDDDILARNNNALATNHALVRRLGGGYDFVNAQRLHVTHLVEGSNICLLALGAPRILRLYKRRCMDPSAHPDRPEKVGWGQLLMGS
jgi:hypothetical protein